MEEQVKEETTQQEEQWHHMLEIQQLSGLKRKVIVTYDNIAVKMAFDKATQSVGKRVMINGFRRGKAPKALVERFCKKEIETTASTMLAQEGYLHAVYEHKLAAPTSLIPILPPKHPAPVLGWPSLIILWKPMAGK